MTDQENIYNFSCLNNKGEEKLLSEFSGEVLLIVNTASKCGFTPQYAGLEKLFQKYKEKGFQILAFPCNQFGGQEPGNDQEIEDFCSLNFNTSFPLFSKIEVNGDNAHPLFKYLTSSMPGILGTESVKWNFTKFLINKDGIPVERFAPNTSPEKIDMEIKSLLN
ncbi:MAG: glutathione peroxidase [SAR86 cluster bacterium]|jgi:glutathione peroxidase|nr:glutathione peroxidase [SAR86 cluster bacterium]